MIFLNKNKINKELKKFFDEQNKQKLDRINKRNNFLSSSANRRRTKSLLVSENLLNGNKNEAKKGRKRVSSIKRKHGKRNLLGDTMFINHQSKNEKSACYKIYSIYDIEPNLNDDKNYELLKSIAITKNIEIMEHYSIYDIYFLLKLIGENVNIFPKEYNNLFDKYLYVNAIDTSNIISNTSIDNNYINKKTRYENKVKDSENTKIKDSKINEMINNEILKYLILPKLFGYEINYLKSYFLLCLDSSDNKILSLIYHSLKKIKKHKKICTEKQFRDYFSPSVNLDINDLDIMKEDQSKSGNKEDIIYLLLSIIDCGDKLSDISVVEYFRLDMKEKYLI